MAGRWSTRTGCWRFAEIRAPSRAVPGPLQLLLVGTPLDGVERRPGARGLALLSFVLDLVSASWPRVRPCSCPSSLSPARSRHRWVYAGAPSAPRSDGSSRPTGPDLLTMLRSRPDSDYSSCVRHPCRRRSRPHHDTGCQPGRDGNFEMTSVHTAFPDQVDAPGSAGQGCSVRLSLKPRGSARGALDGARWPRRQILRSSSSRWVKKSELGAPRSGGSR